MTVYGVATLILGIGLLVPPLVINAEHGANDNTRETEPIHYFDPPTREWQINIAKQLGLSFKHSLNRIWLGRGNLLGAPRQTKKIKGDGNCFFRAVAYCITGDQHQYKPLRAALVQYMKTRMKALCEEARDKKYMAKLAEDKTFATDVEIIAMANMLQTPIRLYSVDKYNNKPQWQWMHFNSVFSIKTWTSDGPSIYLYHAGLIHFEVVYDVY